jgi:transketolase
MAMAEARLSAEFNREGFPVVDHYPYVLSGDGCLMEGVASEAASLAGHLGLGKLILLYDRNQITIEGSTNLAFTEDVGKRFEAYGWTVQELPNGEDIGAIDTAIQAAKADKTHPSLIIVHTEIAHGTPKANSAGAHCEPLGETRSKPCARSTTGTKSRHGTCGRAGIFCELKAGYAKETRGVRQDVCRI